MTEKIARLSQAEERLVINMSRMEQKSQESEEMMVNLQNALERKQSQSSDVITTINCIVHCVELETAQKEA